jgi:hypothetical protein
MELLSALVTRTAEGLEILNTLVVPTGEVRLRFQIAPGTGGGLGISRAQFSLLFGGEEFASGTTDANGEVGIPIQQMLSGGVVVRIFGTDYNVTFHPKLQPVGILTGQQKRLDIMGYITGYQLGEFRTASGRPDDNINGVRTQQAIMNFQTDQSLDIDGVIGPQTINALKSQVGE